MDVIPIIHCGDEHEYRLKNFIPLNLTGMGLLTGVKKEKPSAAGGVTAFLLPTTTHLDRDVGRDKIHFQAKCLTAA